MAMIDFIKFKLQGRSPKWRKVRKEHLADPFNLSCNACMRKKGLEVHHIIPFDLRPDLELQGSNLITLCKYCHFIFGHFGDYTKFNPSVRDDVKWYLIRLLSQSGRTMEGKKK